MSQQYPGWKRDTSTTSVWISTTGRCPKCRRTHKNGEFLCLKCHIRVRYPFYVEPDEPSQDTGTQASQDIRQKPSALPIPIRSGPQGNKTKGKTPRGKTPKNAAKADTKPGAGPPAQQGKPANDEPAFFPQSEEERDVNLEQKENPPDDPDALEKVLTFVREAMGEDNSMTLHVKTRWEAAVRARDNPKVKKEGNAEKQLLYANRKLSKAETAVIEADNQIQLRMQELDAIQELANQKAIAVCEAKKHKEDMLAAKAAAAKEAEETRMLYLARQPVGSLALLRGLLAAQGVTDPSTLTPEDHAEVRNIEAALQKIGAAHAPPQPQPAAEPEAPAQAPQQLVVQPSQQSEVTQQGCPAPPPHKKGKGAAGTPCAKPPKDDNEEEQRHRKKPDTDSQMALSDVPGDATPALSCS